MNSHVEWFYTTQISIFPYSQSTNAFILRLFTLKRFQIFVQNFKIENTNHLQIFQWTADI